MTCTAESVTGGLGARSVNRQAPPRLRPVSLAVSPAAWTLHASGLFLSLGAALCPDIG